MEIGDRKLLESHPSRIRVNDSLLMWSEVVIDLRTPLRSVMFLFVFLLTVFLAS